MIGYFIYLRIKKILYFVNIIICVFGLNLKKICFFCKTITKKILKNIYYETPFSPLFVLLYASYAVGSNVFFMQ